MEIKIATVLDFLDSLSCLLNGASVGFFLCTIGVHWVHPSLLGYTLLIYFLTTYKINLIFFPSELLSTSLCPSYKGKEH